jgi:phage major head subunit gpT-like protein
MQQTLTRFLFLAAALAIGALACVGLDPTAVPVAVFHMGDGSGDALAGLMFAGLTVNRATLDTVFNGLKTLFNNALVAQTGMWQETAMEVPSSGAGEDYAWLSRFPKFKKWVGDKTIKNIAAGKYFVKNEDWETTIAVARNDLEDDRLGIYNIQARSAGTSAGELHDIIVDTLKNGAFANLCYDGQYFYDTDHQVAGANVSNKLAVALSAASTAAATASYGAARVAIMGFKDDEGMPLRLIPDVLEVPPALESTARLICEGDKLTDQSPNPYKGTARVVVNPALTSSTAWFLHCTRQVVKPFIVQLRKAPVFVQQISQENDDVFTRGEFKFGAEARATGTYGFWQLSVGSTG